jgi:hypothetical protein
MWRIAVAFVAMTLVYLWPTGGDENGGGGGGAW